MILRPSLCVHNVRESLWSGFRTQQRLPKMADLDPMIPLLCTKELFKVAHVFLQYYLPPNETICSLVEGQSVEENPHRVPPPTWLICLDLIFHKLQSYLITIKSSMAPKTKFPSAFRLL